MTVNNESVNIFVYTYYIFIQSFIFMCFFTQRQTETDDVHDEGLKYMIKETGRD